MTNSEVNWREVPQVSKDKEDNYLPPDGLSSFYVTNVSMNKDIERCVMPGCGGDTGYLIRTPIQQRVGYVEGAGQLCSPCYNTTYGGKNGGH